MLILEHNVKTAFIDIYFNEEGFLFKSHNRIISQIKDETIIINGKEYVDMSSYNTPDIFLFLPELPEAFKTKELNELLIQKGFYLF
jgi:hypothetical protein